MLPLLNSFITRTRINYPSGNRDGGKLSSLMLMGTGIPPPLGTGMGGHPPMRNSPLPSLGTLCYLLVEVVEQKLVGEETTGIIRMRMKKNASILHMGMKKTLLLYIWG